MPQGTLLNHLRSRSCVDYDSFNIAKAAQLGPFQDSTSNQAIAYFELREQQHQHLVQEALSISQTLSGNKDATQAVDVAMTMLALRMLQHLSANARDIIRYAKIINPTVDISRLCIKIPGTWEGLQACRLLESEGIKTLATTVFSREQVALAGQVGCSYVAPYINELRVHFDPGFKDPDPGLQLIPWAQAYYKSHGHRTQVMPASLTSVKEVMALAGSNHITVAPQLLEKLHDTIASGNIIDEYPSVFDEAIVPVGLEPIVLGDQALFDEALAKGTSGRKLDEAIETFCDFQQKLETMFKEAIDITGS